MATLKCPNCGRLFDGSKDMCPHCGALNTAPLWQDYNRDYANPFESQTRKSNTKKQDFTKKKELNKVDKDSKKTMSLIFALCLPVLIFAFLVNTFGDKFASLMSDQYGFFWEGYGEEREDVDGQDHEDQEDAEIPMDLTYYYDPVNQVLLYHEGLGYRATDWDTWWKYDADEKDWSIYVEQDPESFVDSVTADDQYDLTEDPLHFITGSMDYQDVAIEFSHGYVDEGGFHIPEYLDYYYESDGEYYFFFNTYNYDGEEDEDDTGWYRYDPEEGWVYYCTLDDHETLGDELWYRPLSHTLFTLKRYTTDYAKHYGFTDFRKTDVYMKHV